MLLSGTRGLSVILISIAIRTLFNSHSFSFRSYMQCFKFITYAMNYIIVQVKTTITFTRIADACGIGFSAEIIAARQTILMYVRGIYQ